MSFIMVHCYEFKCLKGTQGDVKLTLSKAFRVLANMTGVSGDELGRLWHLSKIREQVKTPYGIRVR